MKLALNKGECQFGKIAVQSFVVNKDKGMLKVLGLIYGILKLAIKKAVIFTKKIRWK